MKRFFQFLAASALVVSMLGCSKDSAIEPTPDSPVQLQLTGEINQTTRVNESGFEANDKVGVYVSTSGTLNASGNTLNNEAFTYTDGKLVAPEGKEVYWGSDDVRLSVWAYYPYAEYIEDNSAYEFSVNEDQSAAANFYNSDFVFASKTSLPPQESPVELAFDHALSKIAITLTAGEGTTAEDLAEMEKSFYINGVVVDGTIDLSDGTATKGSTVATVTPLASADGLGYSAIVYPQSGNVSFRMEIGENVYLYSADVDFAAGYQYKYTFKINVRDPQGMTLSSATINPWEDDENPVEEELSDIITFTDPKFKEYLLGEMLYEKVEYNYDSEKRTHQWGFGLITDKQIDINNDGEISIAEAEAVVAIKPTNLGITDLSELHYFVNLEYLDCMQNQITSLDVSKNAKLKYIQCRENNLTSIDVSNNSSLMTLDCNFNEISSLDVSNNPNLHGLWCEGNQLDGIDVSNQPNIVSLFCSSNTISTIDLSNNTMIRSLTCANNQLEELDISKQADLTYLYCDNNKLASLDVCNNEKLDILMCGGNQLAEINLSNNIMLTDLSCWSNNLTMLDVTNNTKLIALTCRGNLLTTLDISKNLLLTELVCNPMDNAEGNNLLETIYMADGQEENFETLEKPEETTIEVKE